MKPIPAAVSPEAPRTTRPPLSLTAWPVTLTVLVHLALLTVHVAKYGGDVSALVGASREAANRPPYECITKAIGPGGYDGMFYYALSRDPWHRHDQGFDWPAARQLRILYPIVCWLFSGGDPRLLLWIMPAVNLLLIGGLAYVGALFAWRHGLSVWWGVLLPVAVNAALPALRNLTDNFSTLAVFGLLAAWLSGASWRGLILWSAAALFSREQNAAVVALLLALAAWNRRYGEFLGLGGVLLLWLGWVGLLRLRYGVWPFLSAPDAFGMPLDGLTYAWTHLGGFIGSRRLAIFNSLSLLHWVALMGAAVYLLLRRNRDAIGLFLAAGLLLCVLAGSNIWNDLFSYRRVLVWLPVGVWVASVQARLTWALWLLGPAGIWSLAAALRYV